MEYITAAIKYHALNILRQSTLRELGADLLGIVFILALQVALESGIRSQRLAVAVVDDLRIHMTAAAENREARTLGIAIDFFANTRLVFQALRHFDRRLVLQLNTNHFTS